MDQWITRFRNADSISENEKVMIPGDPEREMEIERMKNGIPLIDAVVKDIQELAVKFDVML
jgi:LDH2 family malate/lactate/ureidoglycolate dehydrogenase